MENKAYGIAFTIISVLIFANLVLGINNKGSISSIYQRQEKILSDFARLRADMDIMNGKMQVYQNVPIDLRSRIEILETRYENLIFFQRQIDKGEKIKPPQNPELDETEEKLEEE
jgi:hypothetical protein